MEGTVLMKQKVTIILSLIFAFAITLIPAYATEEEGYPLSPNTFAETEFVEAYDEELTSARLSQKLLGSYTIQQYLNNGYFLYTTDSFKSNNFPEDRVFKIVTNLSTEGTKKTVEAGIGSYTWLGDRTFFASTTVDLVDSALFQCNSKPKENESYYGAILNNTGGKMYGSFSIYAVYP